MEPREEGRKGDLPVCKEPARAHLRISGRVQGVYFRATAQDTGRALGLTGWIRNLADGSVEAVFEGPRERLEEMVEWCRHGPPQARVDGVDLSWGSATGEFSTLRVTC